MRTEVGVAGPRRGAWPAERIRGDRGGLLGNGEAPSTARGETGAAAFAATRIAGRSRVPGAPAAMARLRLAELTLVLEQRIARRRGERGCGHDRA